MTRKAIDELGDLQRDAMEALWQLGEATVQEVRDAIRRDLAYTTVLSVLQKLSKAGWVRHRKKGRNYLYRAARSRSEESGRSVRNLVRGVFSGDPAALFQHLIEDERIEERDLMELRKMIDRRRKELRDG